MLCDDTRKIGCFNRFIYPVMPTVIHFPEDDDAYSLLKLLNIRKNQGKYGA